MKKEFTCFFTGHRLLPKNKVNIISELLQNKIRYLIENKGVTSFIAGGALGFDTLAAETVIKMKDEYPDIKLSLYLPCYYQSAKWNNNDRYKWRMIMTKVDDYKYITEGPYEDGCMQKRNYKMADDALYCLSYCVMQKSGTGMTLYYAKERGNIIENLADEIYL